MSLIVNNVVSSSVKIEYSYLDSDELFGFIVEALYEINISDVQFDAGGGVLLSGRAAIRTAYETQNITARIGGDEFVNGLITSLSFQESNLVGSEIASITIRERKMLNSYSAKTFAKHMPSPHLVESFSEDYDFSRSGSDYSYKRRVSLKYAQDAGGEFLKNAQVFLSNFYHLSRPSLGFHTDGISENARISKGFAGQLTENIDLVNLEVTLNEDFESSFIDETNRVSKKTTTKISQGDDGYLSKEISIDLTSLDYNYQNVIQSAVSTCIDSVVSSEQSEFGQPYSISKGITKDSKKASISISFSTNPNLSGNNEISFSCAKQKKEAFFEYNLSVRYKASGRSIFDRYNKTLELWNSSKALNEIKVSRLFPESLGVIFESSRSSSILKSEGVVEDKIVFTTNDDYNNSSLPDGILKYQLTLNKTNQIKRSEKILDLTSLREKLIVSDLDTLGQASVTASAVADPNYGIYHAKEFLKTKTSEMEAKLSESTYYLVGDQTTIDLSNGTTNRVISFVIS